MSWEARLWLSATALSFHSAIITEVPQTALARQLNVICVTEDRKLQIKFPELAVSMRAVCAAAGPI
jgi:hypothetical protein